MIKKSEIKQDKKHLLNSERGLEIMPKTIRELADQLNVSKQTIQYHYQRLPAKNRQKDSQGTNMISPKAERIIRDKVAKPLLANNQQIDLLPSCFVHLNDLLSVSHDSACFFYARLTLFPFQTVVSYERLSVILLAHPFRYT